MENVKILDVINYLEKLVPLSTQEDYDNCGLLVGEKDNLVTNILISLDCTEEIVQEAIDKKCEMVISHHPIIFKGLKKITGSDYVQRTILKAIKNGIAIYAIHTNLDNYRFGVNYQIAKRLGLKNTSILAPKEASLSKLIVYVPEDHVENLSNFLFEAGAGNIGDYSECHFKSIGIGTFKPGFAANPFDGEIGKRSEVREVKTEYLVENSKMRNVLAALFANHPYEEIAYDIVPIENENKYEGAGMIGELDEEISQIDFINKVKELFQCDSIRTTKTQHNSIRKVALCGGSGSFLIQKAKIQKADVYITSDVKYHEFFDADNQILLMDIGHYESEQYTKHLIADILKKNFTKFAIHLTERNTNPIKYW
jgi:dinuclear metal center YbgI/SA1388 family protein